MAVTLHSHTKGTGTNGATTTPTINKTAGGTTTLTVVHVAQYKGGTLTPPQDSQSNLYITALTGKAGPVETYSKLFYKVNPSCGASHSWTVSNTGIYASFQVANFMGTDTSSPYESESGNTSAASASTIAPGSVTPAADGSLVVTGFSWNTSSSAVATIDGSFVVSDQSVYGAGEGGALAYLLSSSGAANPTWTIAPNTSNDRSSTLAVFKAAAAGASFLAAVRKPMMQAIQRASVW